MRTASVISSANPPSPDPSTIATAGLMGLFEAICLAANSAWLKSSLMLMVFAEGPFFWPAPPQLVRNPNCNAIVRFMLVSRSLKTTRICLLAVFIAAVAPSAWPQKKPAPASAEQKVARYFESVRSQPLLLHAFLQQMPKGGDLHNHLSGAVYAESFITWAAQDGLCVDRAALAITQPPCD